MKNKHSGMDFFINLIHRWRYLGLFLVVQLIPPYASTGYPPADWWKVNTYILTQPIKGLVSGLFPIFKILPVVLLIGLILLRQKVSRIFFASVSITYLFTGVLQNATLGNQYGVAISISNVITFIAIAGLWMWETAFPLSRVREQRLPWWRYWPFLLALLPFWEPVDAWKLTPNFDPRFFLYSGAGLSFCMITPLILAVLLVLYEEVNEVMLVCTAFVGLWMGLCNFVLEFMVKPEYWWVGVLHIPLVVLSATCLVQAAGRKKPVKKLERHKP